ncbi:MAG TPA: hypothetical protein DIT94_12700, partial [Deltaproteobacteria bacterium]|nr:hypothetical protein [Deltaproteobacteria bacterium]
MEPTDNKKPPHQEEIELDAVDLEKIPKRVRKSKGKPAALKQKPVQPNKIFIPDEENRPRGTQKKLLPLPFEKSKKHPLRSGKFPKKSPTGFSQKDSTKKVYSRRHSSKSEMPYKA